MNPMGDGDGGFGGIDFSKLGAGQGAGGMSDLGDMANADEDSSDDDDEDMPGLEESEEKPEAATETAKKTEEATTTAAPKIQEVE